MAAPEAGARPRIEQRPEAPYVSVTRSGRTGDQFRAAVDSGFPALFGWIGAHGAPPAGPPFLRYLAFAPEGPFEIEIGVPVGDGVLPGGEVAAGVLPAGRYAACLHVGAYRATTPRWQGNDLAAAQERLARWAAQEGVAWDEQPPGEDGVLRRRAWLERYLVGPGQTDDPARWQTELLCLVR